MNEHDIEKLLSDAPRREFDKETLAGFAAAMASEADPFSRWAPFLRRPVALWQAAAAVLLGVGVGATLVSLRGSSNLTTGGSPGVGLPTTVAVTLDVSRAAFLGEAPAPDVSRWVARGN